MFQVIVGGLPAAYQKALRDKERQIMLWQKTVKETGLTKEQRKCFQATVEATFQVNNTHSHSTSSWCDSIYRSFILHHVDFTN